MNQAIDQIIEEKIKEVTKRSRRPRGWVVLNCDGWLHGSINAWANLEQMCVFSKLIVMAEKFGSVPGLISDNDFRPLPHEYLAHQACCPLEVFEETLELCRKEGSVYENSRGIFLVHFDEYQFTEYDRQKVYRLAQKAALDATDPKRYEGQKYSHMIQQPRKKK